MLKWFLYGLVLIFGTASQRQEKERLAAEPVSPNALRAGHEVADASARGVFIVGAGSILAAVAMWVGLSAGFRWLEARYRGGAHLPVARAVNPELVEQRQPPPAPRLQRRPPADYRAFARSQNQALESYAWSDAATGTVRVPIERAMEKVANGK